MATSHHAAWLPDRSCRDGSHGPEPHLHKCEGPHGLCRRCHSQARPCRRKGTSPCAPCLGPGHVAATLPASPGTSVLRPPHSGPQHREALVNGPLPRLLGDLRVGRSDRRRDTGRRPSRRPWVSSSLGADSGRLTPGPLPSLHPALQMGTRRGGFRPSQGCPPGWPEAGAPHPSSPIPPGFPSPYF